MHQEFQRGTLASCDLEKFIEVVFSKVMRSLHSYDWLPESVPCQSYE